MNERPGYNPEFFHPENKILAQQISYFLFTPGEGTPEQESFKNSKTMEVSCGLRKKDDPSEVIIVKMFNDHPDEASRITDAIVTSPTEVISILHLPTFRITRRKDFSHAEDLPTRFGPLPIEVIDATGARFNVSVEYYLDLDGQGFRHESVLMYPFDPSLLPIMYPEVNWHQEKKDSELKKVDLVLSNDDRCIPLADADRKYIGSLFEQFEIATHYLFSGKSAK